MKTFNKFALDPEALKHVSGGASQQAMDQIETGTNNSLGVVDYGFVDLIDFVEDKTGHDIDEEKIIDFVATIKEKKNKWSSWGR